VRTELYIYRSEKHSLVAIIELRKPSTSDNRPLASFKKVLVLHIMMSTDSPRGNMERKRKVIHVTDDQNLETEVRSMVKSVTLYDWKCTLTLQISTDKDIRIDPKDRSGKGRFEFPEPPEIWKDWKLCAVLVKQQSEKGAARITGGHADLENIVTGPDLEPAQWIAIVGEGQTLMILGSSTFRCFYIRPDSPHS